MYVAARTFKREAVPTLWTVGAFSVAAQAGPPAAPGAVEDHYSAGLMAAGAELWGPVGAIVLEAPKGLSSPGVPVSELGWADDATSDLIVPVFGLNVAHPFVSGPVDASLSGSMAAVFIDAAVAHVSAMTGIDRAPLASASFITMHHNSLMLSCDDAEAVRAMVTGAVPSVPGPAVAAPVGPAAAGGGPIAAPIAAPMPAPVAAPVEHVVPLPDTVPNLLSCFDCETCFNTSDEFVAHVLERQKCMFCDVSLCPMKMLEHIGEAHALAEPAGGAGGAAEKIKHAGHKHTTLKKAWDLIEEFPFVAHVSEAVSNTKMKSLVATVRAGRFAKPPPGTASRGGVMYRDPKLKLPLLLRELRDAAQFGVTPEQVYDVLETYGQLYIVKESGAKRRRGGSSDEDE